MKTRDQILTFLAENKKLFRDKFHITRIGLFGSYARGDQNIKSDVDLLVEFEDNTQDLYDLKLEIKDYFLSNLGLEIDICREKYIKPRIKKSILKETLYVD
jgi:predicted nucleotidyltransferase